MRCIWGTSKFPRRLFLCIGVNSLALSHAALRCCRSARKHKLQLGRPQNPARRHRSRPKPVRDIGARLELFIDSYLVSSMTGTEWRLREPIDAGTAVRFDSPWEGQFGNFVTVLFDGSVYRLYYRGRSKLGQDGIPDEVTCYAESKDGIRWTKPDLGLFEVQGSRHNNVVLDKTYQPAPHNFAPFHDTRSGVPAYERYKALGGLFDNPDAASTSHGLLAFASPDGIHWKPLRDIAVIDHSVYPVKYTDTAPASAFWSESEQVYVAYIRVWAWGRSRKPLAPGWGGNFRWVGRTTSKDFIHWTPVEFMTYGDAPREQIYINQTEPYFRAPHIYIGLGARFMEGRQVITPEQAGKIGVDPGYFHDCSDAVLLTSRGGNRYDRAFPEGFVRPDVGAENWVSRTNYPARGIVPTGPTEISFYVIHGYAQPTCQLHRYTLRTDRFASVHAPHRGGAEFLTKPLRFSGKELFLNFATSAAGGIRVEILDLSGSAIPGYTLEESIEMIGNEIERAAEWKEGSHLGGLVGKAVRFRFLMDDADLYALRFR